MLILSLEGLKPQEFRFTGDTSLILLGRLPVCSVCIPDPLVSSKHARIELINGKYFFQDLGSTNGSEIKRGDEIIIIKDDKSKQITLSDGDLLELGNSFLRVSVLPDPVKIIEEEPPEIEDRSDETIFFKQNLSDLDELNEKITEEKSNLQLLNKMLGATRFVDGRDKLLEIIADTISEALEFADNIIILQKDADDEFEPVFTRTKESTEEKTLVSNTIVQQVVEEKVALLYTDAFKEIKGSESIFNLEIHSAICVPLWNRGEVSGIVQVDNRSLRGAFTQEDLSITTVLGHYAAIALENMVLYEKAIESKEKEERARRIFQKYVPHEVVKEVLAEGEGSFLIGNRRLVSILFSDIRGFTQISEKLEPEELVKILNRYFSSMIDVVVKNNGVLDKFLGDGIMAVFGAPISYEDDTFNAVLAAIEMVQRLKDFNKIQREEGKVEFQVGIGVHTGPVVAGNIGSDLKMEYTVIGDTVNTTHRIEELTYNMENAILISQTTYDLVKDSVDVSYLGPVELKGKSQSLKVYKVTGLKDMADTTSV